MITPSYETLRNKAAALEQVNYTLVVALEGTTALAQRYHELFGYPDHTQADMDEVDQQIKRGLDSLTIARKG